MAEEELPKTVEEAVNRILAGMDDANKTRVRETPRDKLILFHHGWGTGIRNAFGLWSGNTALLESCGERHPDDASMVIIEAVWARLQQR